MVENKTSSPVRPVRGLWLAFNPDTQVDAARFRFAERFGQLPVQVVYAGAVLLVGPVPGSDNDEQDLRWQPKHIGRQNGGISTDS